MQTVLRLIIFCGASILLNASVLGCECDEKKLAQYFDLSNLLGKMNVAVFSGKVMQQTPNGYLKKTLVRFQVFDAWKNVTTGEQTIIAKPNSNACGYDFTTGKTYFVVAYRVGNNYETSLCTPTNDLFRAKKMMQELDKITPRKRNITTPKP